MAMFNQSNKRNFVKFVMLGLSVASFSMTSGLVGGLLATPLPVVTGFTVKDLLAVLGGVGFYLMQSRQV